MNRLRITLSAVAAASLVGLIAPNPASAAPTLGSLTKAGCATASGPDVRCFAEYRAAHGMRAATATVTPPGLSPADIASAYALSGDGGAGRTVAIVDAYDDPNAESDLATYRATYGLPPCTTANGCFHKLNQAGAAGPYPDPDPGWSVEISLDLDAVSAACPRCSIALVEGVSEFLARALVDFRKQYPGIDHSIQIAGAQGVVDLILSGQAEIGLTFNPPNVQTVRLERTIVYQLGAVVAPGHPLADRAEVSFPECADYGLVIPDDSISLRAVLDTIWSRTIGGHVRGAITANGIGLLKALVRKGAGVGMLTPIDVAGELEAGELVFVPLSELNVPLSVLSLITAGGRTLSTPASLLVQHVAQTMRDTGGGGIG